MGGIYKYRCTGCSKIKGTVCYGRGMDLFGFEGNKETGLFGCDSCGKVFDGDIKRPEVKCPKCKQKAYELKVFNDEEDTAWDDNDDLPEIKPDPVVKCPNCKTGNLELEWIGLWD